MSSKSITVLLHLMKTLFRSDHCFSKVPYHHRVSLMQSSSSFDQVCKQVRKKNIGTSTTTHSIFQLESTLTDKQGGLYETNTIRIVCNYTVCRNCNRHWPSTVVTIYPCMKPFIWIRNTAKNVMSQFSFVGYKVIKLTKKNDKKPQRQRPVEWNLSKVLTSSQWSATSSDWYMSYWLLTMLLWVTEYIISWQS